MMTVGLLAVVVYLYTVVAFNFFRKFYNKSEDEDEPDMKCDDMMTVSLVVFSTSHHGSPGSSHHLILSLCLSSSVLSLPHVCWSESRWRNW